MVEADIRPPLSGPNAWLLLTLPNQVVALNARGELGNVARTTLQGYSASNIQCSLVEFILDTTQVF